MTDVCLIDRQFRMSIYCQSHIWFRHSKFSSTHCILCLNIEKPNTVISVTETRFVFVSPGIQHPKQNEYSRRVSKATHLGNSRFQLQLGCNRQWERWRRSALTNNRLRLNVSAYLAAWSLAVHPGKAKCSSKITARRHTYDKKVLSRFCIHHQKSTKSAHILQRDNGKLSAVYSAFIIYSNNAKCRTNNTI